MAGNNERNNLYRGEGNMLPSHKQYSSGSSFDNNVVLRPPPGLSPVPRFHGNNLMNHELGQQLSFPLMSNGQNLYGVPPPPGYAFFTPPQSPPFMHSGSVGNLDHQFFQQQGFVQPSSAYQFPSNDFQHCYENEGIDFRSTQSQPPNAIGELLGPTTKVAEMKTGFIEPIIENIVSSSSDGTYTHFGSAHPVVGISSLANSSGGGRLSELISGSNENEKKYMNQISEVNTNGFSNKSPGSPRLDNAAVQRPCTPISPALSSKAKNNSLDSQVQQGKPSYLEVLTKNCKNSENEKKSSINKTYASASDVQSTRDSPTLGHPFGQIHNQVYRKLSDGYLGAGGSGGEGTSNSSASSSPIVKPKANQLKGKENNFIQNNGTHHAAMTNSKSPSKSSGSNASGGAAQVRNSANEWTKKVGNSKRSNNKFQGKNLNYVQNVGAQNDDIMSVTNFDFDIEDLDDEDSAVSREDKSSKKKSSETSKDKGKKSNGSLGNGISSHLSNERKTNENKIPNGQITRKGRVEKCCRSRREDRNCVFRRLKTASGMWLAHVIAALNWFWTLLLSVTTLSATLGYSLMEDVFNWWKIHAVPKFLLHLRYIKGEFSKLKFKLRILEWSFWSKEDPSLKKPPETPSDLSELLSVLGPERNIVLPANGDEALQRLLSVKGKDPYSILGVRSDCTDDTIKRYYKRQAVLVHPDKNLVVGAEEAFKILARAFELVGEPVKRAEYHRQLLEAHAKERFMGEFGNLFEQLRKKMESVCTTIRCTKCNSRHKKNRTDRPVFAARYCAQCRIHHAAREGELWAEKKGMFGFWQYFACMGNQVWEMNEWGKCQRKNLNHLVPDSHQVIYRLVSGTQTGQQRNSSGGNNSTTNPDDDLLDPEMDDWDSLIHNLCRASSTNSCNGSSGANAFNGSTGSSKKRKGKRK